MLAKSGESAPRAEGKVLGREEGCVRVSHVSASGGRRREKGGGWRRARERTNGSDEERIRAGEVLREQLEVLWELAEESLAGLGERVGHWRVRCDLRKPTLW